MNGGKLETQPQVSEPAVKTSRTHPLEIHAVTTPSGGQIGMTMCPGKQQPHAITGPWHRDLATDMDAIRDFGTETLISLMEGPELADAAVPAEMLQQAARDRGMTWMHCPIPDFAAPDAAFEDDWKIRGPKVRALLKNGRRVVLHCRGGRGRAGLMAARLLVELGLDPNEAITAVRTANPLAIETIVQEEHVRQCRPAPATGM